MSIVRPSWAGWDWHCVNNQTETDPKSPEEQTAGAGWVWAWFSWCSDITGCCFNTILVSHQPGLLPVCSLSNYRHHISHWWPLSRDTVSLSSLSLLASPGLSWTQVTLKPGTSCCLALLCSLGPRLPTLSPTVLLESSEGGGSFHSSAALSRSRNPRHVQSREWPRHGAWRPVTGARAADCWYLVWVRPSLPWPKPWPGPSLVTGPAAVKLVVKISNHRISAGLESMIM